MNSSTVMLALADRLNVVSSSKVMPSDAVAPVRSRSPLKIGSCTFNRRDTALRVAVTLPCTLATLPTSSASG